MSWIIREILENLEDFEDSPLGVGHELRLSVAEIVLRHLRRKGLSQRDLALRIGLKESYVSRVVHSNANCTLDTVGKFLHALGLRARVQEATQTDLRMVSFSLVESNCTFYATRENTHGKETSQKTAATEVQPISQKAALA